MKGSKAIPCILVVEDDRTVREVLVTFLKGGGYKDVIAAGNAEEAMFYLFKDRGLDVRVAIIDLVLPNPVDGGTFHTSWSDARTNPSVDMTGGAAP